MIRAASFRSSLSLLLAIHLSILVPSIVLAGPATLILDNSDPGYSDASTDAGTWQLGSSAPLKYGPDYKFGHSTLSTSLTTGTATWQPDLPYAGDYKVYAWWTAGGNRSDNAPFNLNGDQGSVTVRVNQQINGGQWNLLGTHHFAAGTAGSVTLTNNANGIVVMADAIKFEYANEVRAFWASRFEWPSANMATAQSNITNILNAAQTHRFNTVLMQVRGQMDVHYNSPYEPWTNTYGWTNPGWDPLQYAVTEAHSRNLELHAYFNTHTLASPVPPAVTTPQHMYNVHGPGAPIGAENWTIHNTGGNPQTSTNSSLSNYYWLSPGIPEASWWTRRAVVHLIQNYAVDGVHFDRIRTPGPGYSYDPISVARFNGDGNPDDLDWGDWMRSQITRDLRNIYGEVMYWRPEVKLSSSPIGICRRDSDTTYQGWGSASYFNYYQDTWGWLDAHVQDFVVPQIYWEMNSNHAFEKLLDDWMTAKSERFIVGGSRTAKTVSSDGLKPVSGLMAEQLETRNQNAAGHCVFSYGGLDDIPPGDVTNYWTGFSTGPYDTVTTVPEMPWKTRPTTGYITGYVRDALGNAVVDARVNLAGDSYNYLTGFDGFFAILDVPPATTHTLHAFKLTKGSRQQSAVTVSAGGVTSLTLTLNPSRGVVDFDKPRYALDASSTVRVYDADLVGAGTTSANVSSTAEPLAESITLTESTPGLFSGTILLQQSASPNGDGAVRTSPGGSVSVTWTDANDGSGGPYQRSDTAMLPVPDDIFMEPVSPTGAMATLPEYQEVAAGGAVWANTGNYGPNSEVIKSVAPGLTGQRGRWIGTNSQGSYVVFRPQVETAGYYDVYITLPNALKGADNDSPGAGYSIAHDGGTANGTFSLSRFNAGITDQWFKIGSGLKFAAGNSGTIQITNNNASSNDTGQRFSIDAIRLQFVQPIPVSVSGWSAE